MPAAPPEKTIPAAVVTEKGGAHLGAYFAAPRDTPECEAVVLCDPGKTNQEEAKKILGEKLSAVFDDIGTMLMKAKPVMALVSMEAGNASPVIGKSLDGGVHIFAEKPDCLSAAEFEPLVKKAEAANLTNPIAGICFFKGF